MIEMGIGSTGTWFPETYVTAAEIAEQSGLPEWVVREKLGIERKFVADPSVHPNEMAVNAARKAIERAGIDPLDIDVVLSTTGAVDPVITREMVELPFRPMMMPWNRQDEDQKKFSRRIGEMIECGCQDLHGPVMLS